MLGWWTISRASGTGVTAALLAFLLWVLERAHGDPFFWPLLGAAAVTGLCGLSILLVTAGDLMFHRRRGSRVRPLRVFDLALGAGLAAAGFALLHDLAGQLEAVTRS